MSLIKNVKNPISLARTVMERTRHIYLVGESAEKLAIKENLERMDSSYFSTDKRREQLIKAKESGTILNDHDLEIKKVPIILDLNEAKIISSPGNKVMLDSSRSQNVFNLSEMEKMNIEKKQRILEKNGNSYDDITDSEIESIDGDSINVDVDVTVDNAKNQTENGEENEQNLLDSMFPGSTGTVGCVCMLHGHVAAATSTGGLTNKMAGRIGKNYSFYFVFFSFLNIVIINFFVQKFLFYLQIFVLIIVIIRHYALFDKIIHF